MAVAVQNELLSPLEDQRYRIGMCVAIAAVLMLFTSLTSAYIVRAASSDDWKPMATPRILLFSTALILISSGTLEAARRKLRAKLERAYFQWLGVTVLLGTAFLISQTLAWRQLARQGIYLASNPFSSFFYLLTVTHALHLLGGLLALIYLRIRAFRWQWKESVVNNRAAVEAVALYWHVMDALWIYLFLLLFLWR
jgi:cytochrome c oxidase subunit 3